MRFVKLSIPALAGCSIAAVLSVSSAFAGTVSCPDVALPENNVNHFYSMDADAGTCTKVANESEHPVNGFIMYHYYYEYKDFTITETRGNFYRNGEIDSAGTFWVNCVKDSCPQTVSFTDGAGRAQKLLMTQSYSGRSVTAISADLISVGPCNGLSGNYGTAAIVVGEDGNTVNVSVGAARPLAYGTCTGNQLVVTFKDDATYTGTFDGKSVSWSNGTSWAKE
jgi:hypothetical protein